MSGYERESGLVAYCGIYCRQCDYHTGNIKNTAKNLLTLVNRHGELKLFAAATENIDYDNLVKGIEWLSNEVSPCVGGCRGGGGWKECPIRKCCTKKNVTFCHLCSEFPCETLKQFPKRIEELNEIKQAGLKNWIDKKLKET